LAERRGSETAANEPNAAGPEYPFDLAERPRPVFPEVDRAAADDERDGIVPDRHAVDVPGDRDDPAGRSCGGRPGNPRHRRVGVERDDGKVASLCEREGEEAGAAPEIERDPLPYPRPREHLLRDD